MGRFTITVIVPHASIPRLTTLYTFDATSIASSGFKISHSKGEATFTRFVLIFRLFRVFRHLRF